MSSLLNVCKLIVATGFLWLSEFTVNKEDMFIVHNVTGMINYYTIY